MVVEAATEPFVLLLLVARHRRDRSSARSATACSSCSACCPIVGADVVTEYRGERALEALREASAPIARVRRDGAVEDVAGRRPRAGRHRAAPRRRRRPGRPAPRPGRSAARRPQRPHRRVGAGARPRSSRIRATAPLADRHAIAYAGTSVVGGRGEGVVVATGQATEVGRIAGGLGPRGRRRSPLQRELDRLVRILLVVAIGLIVIVTGLGFVRGQTAGENLLAGISAAIAAIPEEPPILLAVILGLGAYRLLQARRPRPAAQRRGDARRDRPDRHRQDRHPDPATGSRSRRSGRLAARSTTPTAGCAILLEALRAEDDAWATGGRAPPGSFTRSLMRAVDRRPAATPTLDPADLLEAEPVADGRP